jgi:hypothetical protein
LRTHGAMRLHVPFRTPSFFVLPVALTLASLSGCGSSETLGGGDAGNADGADARAPTPDGQVTLNEAGARCVTAASSNLVTSCDADPQCVAVYTGEICEGGCLCDANLAINKSSLPTYEAKLGSIQTAGCPCHANPTRCIQHTCVLCEVGGGPCGDS